MKSSCSLLVLVFMGFLGAAGLYGAAPAGGSALGRWFQDFDRTWKNYEGEFSMRFGLHQDNLESLHVPDHIVDPAYLPFAFHPFFSVDPFVSFRTDLKLTPVKGFRVSLWFETLPKTGPLLQNSTPYTSPSSPDTAAYALGATPNFPIYKYSRGGGSLAATLGDTFTVTLSFLDHTEEITPTGNTVNNLGRPMDAFAGAASNVVQNRNTYRFTDQELHLEIRPLKTLPVAPSFKLSAIQTGFEYIKLANPTQEMPDVYGGLGGYTHMLGWEQKKIVPTFNGSIRVQPVNAWWFNVGYTMAWWTPGMDTSWSDVPSYDDLRNTLTLDTSVTLTKRITILAGYRYDYYVTLGAGYSQWRTYPWGAPYDALLSQPLDKTISGEKVQGRSSAYLTFVYK